MYKYLVVGVLFCTIGGAGYYLKKSGGADFLVKAMSQNSEGVSLTEVFSGTFECTSELGCDGVTKLFLNPDATVEVLRVASDENDSETLGKGTWGVAHSGAIVLLLDKPRNASSTYPTSITVKQVSVLRLSNFSTKKKLFPGMDNPTFKRTGGTLEKVENEE
jgi:hypothetical protein